MKDRSLFCTLLTNRLLQVQWRYTTLLAVLIESVVDLPDDCDELINELLLTHPEPAAKDDIIRYLLASQRLSDWLTHYQKKPKLSRLVFTQEQRDQVDTPAQSNTQCNLQSPGALAHWLGVSCTQLDWFAALYRFDTAKPERLNHYRYQCLEKRRGGVRIIEQPKRTLKRMQQQIHQHILRPMPTHPAAHGFCRDRGCLSHATIHVGKRYLLTFDITDCFHSIEWSMVKSVFMRLGYTDKVATYLTALCTHRISPSSDWLDQLSDAQVQRLQQRHLPQGAPTSPALSNAVLRNLDRRLSGLAIRLGMNYSRYADDLAFSGDAHRDYGFMQALVGSICLQEGVELNHRKTRLRKSHQKQRLVGIVVNQKTNIDRQYVDSLKATLTNCVRHGLASQNRHQHPHFREHLLGRIQYVKSLNAQRGRKLEELFHNIAADTPAA